MFVGKARSLPKNEAPERCFTWLSSSLAYKQQTRLERLARDKHSSLLQKFVIYVQKKVYSIGAWYKLITHASLGNDKKPNGAILIQTDQ